MNRRPAQASEMRVLLQLVTAKDTAAATQLLARSGIAVQACADAVTLAHEVLEGAGAVLIAEETLEDPAFAHALGSLQSQPPWSDLPVIVVARTGAVTQSITAAIQQLGNVTVLERPVRVSSLVSAVRSALTSRKRQYQLRSTLDGLREADQRKTEFLATLAHELRNPLAPLRTALTLLSNPQTAPARRQSLHAMMDRQVTHMVRLIDDLMEVSRITRGKIALRSEVIALDRVVRDAIEVTRPLLNAARQDLELDLPPHPCHVHGDAVRLTQVITNLLNNASKFTPAEGRLRISLSSTATSVQVKVSDSGIGIPQDSLESIFEMFVQINETQASAQGGLGIGLTLARSLVELHGGRISATSPGPNAGTTLTVVLPRAEDPPGLETSVPVASGDDVGMKHRILVVDDNRDAADSLVELFNLMGAQVSVAYSGKDALDSMMTNVPTVAFVDIGMPEMDGHQLAARVRATDSLAGVVLIALTGWGQATDRERIRNSGFDHHLIKPAEIRQLTELLHSLA